jgi:hypothetical protein
MKRKISWFLFLLIGWIILIINDCRSKKIHLNFLRELKELCKKHSKYTEDNDFVLIHKNQIKDL